MLRTTGRTMSVPELAAMVGSHPNTCREQLTRLLDAGLVTRTVERSGRRGRPGVRYGATPSDAVSVSRGTSALAKALVEHIGGLPDATDRAMDAGLRWGRSAETDTQPGTPLERLVGLLDGAGFAPVALAGPGHAVGLRACPFGLFASGGPGPACGVHRGLLEGALRGLGPPAHGVVLEPFARPGLCLVHVDEVVDDVDAVADA